MFISYSKGDKCCRKEPRKFTAWPDALRSRLPTHAEIFSCSSAPKKKKQNSRRCTCVARAIKARSGELLYIKTDSSRKLHIFPVFDWERKKKRVERTTKTKMITISTFRFDAWKQTSRRRWVNISLAFAVRLISRIRSFKERFFGDAVISIGEG